MPLRHGRYTDATHRNRRIERIITASVGLVQSGQHLEHNAQRQNAPTHSTPYFAGTIEGKKFWAIRLSILLVFYILFFNRLLIKVEHGVRKTCGMVRA